MPPGDGMQNIAAELEVLILGGTSPAAGLKTSATFEIQGFTV